MVNTLKFPKAFWKKLCVATETFGIKACTEIESRNPASVKSTPLYAMLGKHAIEIKVSPGK